MVNLRGVSCGSVSKRVAWLRFSLHIRRTFLSQIGMMGAALALSRYGLG